MTRIKVAQGPMGPFQGWRPQTLASSRRGREGQAGTHALTTHSFMHQQVPYAIFCLTLGRDANHGNYADSFEQKVRLGLERGQRLHLLLQCAGTVTVA